MIVGLFHTRKLKQTIIVSLGFLALCTILLWPSERNLTTIAKLQLNKSNEITNIQRSRRSAQENPYHSQATRPQTLATIKSTEFKLIFPFVEPRLSPQDKNLYLAVVVNTAANGEAHRTLRQTIRKTWGNSKEPMGNIKNLEWKLFFALAIAVNQSDYAASLQEARDNNDVIIGNFPETYRNVVIKTFMGLLWSSIRLSCKFVLKADDDVYVRVPHLMTWLENVGSPRYFYGGIISKFHLIPRDPTSKWYISYEQYGKKDWPPWCHGSYTVFSSDTIPRYLIYTYKRKPFHTDDAYLGVASEDLQIKAVQIPGFVIEHENCDRVRSTKELNETLTIGHKVKPEFMIKYHEYYQSIYY